MKSLTVPSARKLAPALVFELEGFARRSKLTRRESEVLAILAEGVVRIKDVAGRLELSPNTVNNHINSIFVKTGTKSKSQLLAGLLNTLAEELEHSRAIDVQCKSSGKAPEGTGQLATQS